MSLLSVRIVQGFGKDLDVDHGTHYPRSPILTLETVLARHPVAGLQSLQYLHVDNSVAF